MRIFVWYADSLKVNDVEFLELSPFGQLAADLGFLEVVLLGCSVSSCIHGHLGLKAGLVEDGELGGWWRRVAFDARHPNSVPRFFNTADIGGIYLHIAVQTYVALQLIE
jgi:hypothetical protein